MLSQPGSQWARGRLSRKQQETLGICSGCAGRGRLRSGCGRCLAQQFHPGHYPKLHTGIPTLQIKLKQMDTHKDWTPIIFLELAGWQGRPKGQCWGDLASGSQLISNHHYHEHTGMATYRKKVDEAGAYTPPMSDFVQTWLLTGKPKSEEHVEALWEWQVVLFL